MRVGVDILEISRVKAIRDLPRVAAYILTTEEMEEFNTRVDKELFFASRFAAKEAVIKALPVRVSPQDFRIGKIGEKPEVIFLTPSPCRVSVSLAHSVEYVVGFAAAHYGNA